MIFLKLSKSQLSRDEMRNVIWELDLILNPSQREGNC